MLPIAREEPLLFVVDYKHIYSYRPFRPFYTYAFPFENAGILMHVFAYRPKTTEKAEDNGEFR